jgi:hypothetical protein
LAKVAVVEPKYAYFTSLDRIDKAEAAADTEKMKNEK